MKELYVIHHDKAFAMLHASSAIQDTRWVGMSSREAFVYLQQLVAVNIPFFSSGLNNDQSKIVKEVLADLLAFLDCYEHFEFSKFLRLLHTRASARGGVAYLPAGWIGKPGHCAILKAELVEKNKFHISYLNDGSGSEYHRPLCQGEDKIKDSYESERGLINFDSELGVAFIENIVQLMTDISILSEETVTLEGNRKYPALTKTTKPFDKDDLYGLLAIFADEATSSLNPLLKSATPQRVGSCTITSTKQAIIDALLFSAKLEPNQIKRFIFALKLTSLVVANEAMQRDKCDPELFAWALREAYVRITKHYPEILSAEEVESVTQLIDEMRLGFEQRQDLRLAAVSKVSPMPALQATFENKQLNLSQADREESLSDGSFYDYNDGYFAQAYDNSAKISAKEFYRTLQLDKKFLYANAGKEKSIEILRYFRSLPKTSGNTVDEFWDLVPLNDLGAIIETLTQFCAALVINADAINMVLFEAAMIVYDIVAQVAARIEGLNLGKKYSLGISDFAQDGLVFQDAETYFNIKNIVENFQRRNKGKSTIFTNDVSHELEDKTGDYLINRLMTRERRTEVVQRLKDQGILEYSQPDVPDDVLIKIFLTGEYRSPKSSRIDKPKKVDLASLVNSTYCHILKLTVYVHSLGNPKKDHGQELNYQPSKYGSDDKVDLTIRQQSYFQFEIKLAAELSRHQEASNRQKKGQYHFGYGRGVMRDPCGMPLENLPLDGEVQNNKDQLVDFAENTIYYPIDKLRVLVATSDYYIEKPSSHSVGIGRTPPFQFQFSGAFSPNCPGWRDASENAALECLDEDFRRIEASGALRIQLLFEWLMSNFEKLSYQESRTRLFAMFFEFGYLDYALAWHPEDLCQLASRCFERLFKLAVTYLESSNEQIYGEIFLWLCRLQYAFWGYVSYAAKLYEFPAEGVCSIQVREWILKEIKENKRVDLQGRYAKFILLSFKDQPPESEEDYVCFIAAKLMMVLSENDSLRQVNIGDFEVECAQVWNYYFESVDAYLKGLDNHYLDSVVEKILNLCGIKVAKQEWTYRDDELRSAKRKSSPASIDLKTGNVFNDRVCIRDRSAQFRQKPFLKDLGIDSNNLTFHEKPAETQSGAFTAIFSSDGVWQFDLNIFNNTITAIYKSINIEGVEYWFKVCHGQEQESQQDAIAKFFSSKKCSNPFEADKVAAPEYLYAHKETNPDVLFVEARNGADTGYLYLPDSGWRCLKRQEDGRWLLDQRIFLDFYNPQTEFEKSWEQWINQSLGTYSLHAIARLQGDTGIELESLSWRKFNLTFVNEKGVLVCQQHPGFYWIQEDRPRVLAGMCTLITLVNDKGQKKYLLPPFLFLDKRPAQVGEKNNKALSGEPFIDVRKTLNHEECFEYTFDQLGELCGHSLEADLYLALVYRCLGDYPRAMLALKRTENPRNNTALQVEILGLTEYWPDHSAPGAAFDCQILLRLYRHHGKLSQKPDQWMKENIRETQLLEYSFKQFELYRKNISTRKQGVNIIHDCLRLTPSDKDTIRFLNNRFRGIKSDHVSKNQTEENVGFYSNNFVRTLDYSTEISTMQDYLRVYFKERISHYFSDKMFNDAVHRRQDTAYPLHVRVKFRPLRDEPHYRLQASSKEATDIPGNTAVGNYNARDFSPADFPGYDHLLRYFVNMFEDAVSENPQSEKRVRAKMFMLARNDIVNRTAPFLALLSVVLQNKKMFKSLIGKFPLTRECVRGVARVAFISDYQSQNLRVAPLIPSYTRQVSLGNIQALSATLPQPALCEFSWNHINVNVQSPPPLQALLSETFDTESRAVPTTDFLDSDEELDSLVEQRLRDRLKKGNQENKTLKKVKYKRIMPSHALIDLNQRLIHRSADYKKELAQRERELLDSANSSAGVRDPVSGAYFQAVKQGGQRQSITLSEIVDAFLWQDFGTLQQRNPFLTSQTCHHLISTFIEYAVLRSAYDQTEAAISLINSRNSFDELELHEEQLLGRLLAARRHYSIKDYPEFLVYEYAKKRMIREDQVLAMIQVIQTIEKTVQSDEELIHCLKQFAAGGGKSSLIIIILVARFARRGFLPTIFNTNELYALGLHEVAKNLKEAFNIQIEVIERELNYQWSSNDLARLRGNLQDWRKNKRALLLKPVTWHSIHIAEMIGILDDDKPHVASAESVLDFFFRFSIALVDESYTIFDPLQKSITTWGQMVGVPIQYQRLYLEIYSHLLGVRPESRELAELAGIIHKSKKILTAEELVRLQASLAELMSEFKCFGSLKAIDLREYFLQESRVKPEWLKALRNENAELASLVVSGRSFVKTLLKHLLKLQYNNHYGTSIHGGDLTPAPQLDGKPVEAHFANLLLIVALSFHLYHATGVPVRVLEEMINHFEAKHKQQRQNTRLAVTPAESTFNKLLPKSADYVHFDVFSKAMREMLIGDPAVRHSFELMSEFFLTRVFPQIETPALRIESTASDMQARFQRLVCFDAAPGLQENYSANMAADHYFEMLSFEAEVVSVFLKAENSQHCLFPMTHDPLALFSGIKKQFPELFRKMTTMIDQGFYVSDVDPAVVTKIVYELFDEGDHRKSAMFFDEGDMRFISKDKTLDGKCYPGSDLLSVLKRHNIDPKVMLVFLFINLCKTKGTDVVRPQNDCAFITVGNRQTLSGTIQAANRERLLLEENAQTLQWLMFVELYQKVAPNKKEFDLRIIIRWMRANDAETLTTRIINRAYHEIISAIKVEVKRKIRDRQLSSDNLKPLLSQKQSIDPYLVDELESQMLDTDDVLTHYIESVCELSGMDLNQDLSDICLARLKVIRNQTSALMKLMSQPQGAELNAQVHQEHMQAVKQQQMLRQEQTAQNLLRLGKSIRFASEIYSMETDSLERVFADDTAYKPVCVAMSSVSEEMRLPFLAINHKHFQPFDKTKSREDLLFYKPIQAVLISVMNNKLGIVGCTAMGLQFFEDQIRKVRADNPGRYLLIGVEHNVLSSSANLNSDTKAKIAAIQEVRDALTFMAMLNGRVRNVEELISLIRRYKWTAQDYDAFTNLVQEIHISRSPVELNNIPDLAQRCGWEGSAEESPLEAANLPELQQKVKIERCPVVVGDPSERCSATRIIVPVRSVLASCFFGQKPRAFASVQSSNEQPSSTPNIIC